MKSLNPKTRELIFEKIISLQNEISQFTLEAISEDFHQWNILRNDFKEKEIEKLKEILFTDNSFL